MRIGQIGIGHAHAAGWTKALANNPEVELVGIFEPDPKVLAARSMDPAFEGVNWLKEQELLRDESVTAIFVETRPADNLYWARQALEAGKHVSIDKPPSPSLSELRQILDLAQGRNLHVNMGYMFRSNPAFQFLFEAIESEMLGDIFRIEADIPTSFQGSRYTKNAPAIEKYPGGIFYELGSHFVDLAVIVLGAPLKVTSILRKDYRSDNQSPFIDNTVAIFEYANALAVIQTWAMEVDAFPHRRFEVYGTRGSIRVEPVERPPKLQLCLAKPHGEYVAGWQTITVGDRPRYVGDVAEFVGVVSGQRKPRFGPDHDLEAHRALLQACRVPD